MAVRSDKDLAEIVANVQGLYTSDAVEAARRELAMRPPQTEAEERQSTSPSFRPRKPLGIRIAFWLACIFAVGGTVSLLVLSLMVMAGQIPWPSPFSVFPHGVAALAAWWIVVAIQREHAYARTLLVAVLAASVVYDMLMAAVTRHWSEIISQTSYPLAAIAYLVFSAEVAAYYRRIAGVTVPPASAHPPRAQCS